MPEPLLAVDDTTVMRRDQRADIAPTILERFGLDLDRIRPPLDGHPLTGAYQPTLW